MRFIDLFAGIGGFHVAIKKANKKAKCVFASEYNKSAADVYFENFGIPAFNDVTLVEERKIPRFDLLTAGFPCQPFSKGGKQAGFDDIGRGTLFFEIIRILRFHKPKYILLENVSNIISHDDGNTYRVIESELKKLGYFMPDKPIVLSPTDLNIPVKRPRVFIIGRLNKPFVSRFSTPSKNTDLDVMDYFDFNIDCPENTNLTDYEIKLLNMWDEFIKGITQTTIGFPIWYNSLTDTEFEISKFDWRNRFNLKNQELYFQNKNFIDNWKQKYKVNDWVKNNAHLNFEWQVGSAYNSIFEGLIQFRTSGIRVSKRTSFNTLVAMGHTQVLGPLKRRLSLNELKQLQGFSKDFKLGLSYTESIKQLGNSVHVDVVANIFKYLVK
jgi:DNA (cytosine-5)-methyltransferase 1